MHLCWPGLPTSTSLPHKVLRENIFENVIHLYATNLGRILSEYPFRVGERAVDLGGVSRDMFKAFFDRAYQKLFDGCTLLTPAIHPNINFFSSSTLPHRTIFELRSIQPNRQTPQKSLNRPVYQK